MLLVARILRSGGVVPKPFAMRTIFYKCPTCGNVVIKLVDSSAPLSCCGKPMQELVPNVVDDKSRAYLPDVVLLEDRRLRVDPCPGGHCTLGDADKMFLYVEFEGGGTWLDSTTRSEFLLPIGDHRPIAVYK